MAERALELPVGGCCREQLFQAVANPAARACLLQSARQEVGVGRVRPPGRSKKVRIDPPRQQVRGIGQKRIGRGQLEVDQEVDVDVGARLLAAHPFEQASERRQVIVGRLETVSIGFTDRAEQLAGACQAIVGCDPGRTIDPPVVEPRNVGRNIQAPSIHGHGCRLAVRGLDARSQPFGKLVDEHSFDRPWRERGEDREDA